MTEDPDDIVADRIMAACEDVRDAGELVRRFRRLLDPDAGIATPDEVRALSEYLGRVDALVAVIGE